MKQILIMAKNHKSHDRLFKATFSKKTVAKAYVKYFLPKEIVKALDMRTFKIERESYIDEKLEEHFADMVYSCKTSKDKSLRIALLFEHKSNPVQFIHIQLLTYILNSWKYDLKQKRAQLSLTIPIVLYHGGKRWEKRSLLDYFQGYSEPLKLFLPNFDYILNDLSDYPDQEIVSLKVNFLVNSLILLKHRNDKKYILEKKRFVFFNLGNFIEFEEGESYFRTIFHYLISSIEFKKEEIDFLFENSPQKVKSIVMNTYDKWIQEGIEIESIKSIRSLILNLPNASDSEIAKLLNKEIGLVRKVRAEMKKN